MNTPRPKPLSRFHWRSLRDVARSYLGVFWKVLVGIVGGLVVLFGIVMLPTPVPGWLIILFGLAILSTEFPWVQKHMVALREWMVRRFGWGRKKDDTKLLEGPSATSPEPAPSKPAGRPARPRQPRRLPSSRPIKKAFGEA